MRKVVSLIVLCCILCLISGCSVKKTEELTDAEMFANEYSVSEENPFQYATIDDVLELFENKSGILFLGDSDSEWSTFGAKVLNRVLKEEKISEVYYFNPETIKNKKSKKYQEFVDKLQLKENDSLPIVYVISDGKVLGSVDFSIHEDISVDEKSAEQLEQEYLDLLSQYI